jgi:hypothetical protein
MRRFSFIFISIFANLVISTAELGRGNYSTQLIAKLASTDYTTGEWNAVIDVIDVIIWKPKLMCDFTKTISLTLYSDLIPFPRLFPT